ncbi:hypothetical protein NOS3756_07030 [Nostoc sp. NIES-3756]|uniref:hypothetical protein n=1 Tax=Nostoc sp. NIES-3756 TaxID=1751286 RepID=UPI00072216C1|nr:hypothetical protein [Nostoc sp. NIES-3756]BAT51774.1 hypothetical protein NOS3756_07030 [Nostoc sp. NIES-3756]
MDENNTQLRDFFDFAVAISLPLPQGDSLLLQVEQSHYTFYLNQQIVEQIQQAKNTGTSLNIPPKILLPLWYYSCFSYNFVPIGEVENTNNQPVTKSYIGFILNILKAFGNKSLQKKASLPVGFTFTSYYQPEPFPTDDHIQKKRVLQSVVLFHGDILHKIQEDFLYNNLDFQKIASAHYWLTEQILSALRSKLNLLVWELSALVTSYFFTWNIFNLKLAYLDRNILVFVLIWLFLTIILASTRYFISKELREESSIKYQYLNLASWAITCVIPILFLTSFSISRNLVNIITVLSPLVASFIPIVARRILNFILPRLAKFVIRRILSV